jgi:hypothetical protein
MTATQKLKSWMPIFVPAMLVLLRGTSDTARADVIAPGDRVVVRAEAPLLAGQQTLAAVKPGTTLRAERVSGEWVFVGYTSTDNGYTRLEGWISTQHLVKCPAHRRIRYTPVRTKLLYNHYQLWNLPEGENLTIQFESSNYPVDVFIFSEEGKAAYEWAVKHDSGQAASYFRRVRTRQDTFRWEPPDHRRYYFAVDNTDFPDGGANGSRSTTISVIFWQDDPAPAEPMAGQGLIIGRVTFKFDGYNGQHDRYTRPLTVHVEYKDRDGIGDDHDGQPDGTLQATTDAEGYFSIGNVSPQRHYWVRKIQGHNFEVPVPVRYSSPVNLGGDSREVFHLGGAAISPTLPDKRTSVLDLGEYNLYVNREGKIGVRLTTPFRIVTNKAEETTVSIQEDTSSSLDRHGWFERTYSSSGWIANVRADRSWIESERPRKKEKEENENEQKNA